ncbi:hypothetical protein [Nocardioides bizhenqiangii]|uniref:Uncharacterized protein n=1 Tax=Nocardioides bizhenqiangii TaxID=3095076 RepID=A0ABZ0ZKG9_9ACTN|nr:hypothetical protein [Nocardioides sp. HM61]WQQ24879.1 hypothetical protein SHK19_12965 [Nocardioides sp. HM61]
MESPARRDWLRLVSQVDSWAQSAVPGDGGFLVTLADGRTVVVVMTPDDLDDMYVAFGVFDDIAGYVIRCLAAMPPEYEYLVYHLYDLEPSPDRVLPSEPELPNMTGGRWFAYDPRTGRETPFDSDDDLRN